MSVLSSDRSQITMSFANTGHQPTTPITVTQRSLSQKPFRFLDLPLEIQRNILEKVYEGRYVLKAQPAVLDGISWSGGPPLAPLRTCRHIYCEGLPLYRKACHHLDVSDVDDDRIDASMNKKDRSWILLAVREITMFHAHYWQTRSVVQRMPFTNLQTIRLITADSIGMRCRHGIDTCQYAEEVLNDSYFLSNAGRFTKACMTSSVPPSFRNLVKQATFIGYVGVVEDRTRRWGEFKAVSSGTGPYRCLEINIVDYSVFLSRSLSAETTPSAPMSTAGRKRIPYHLMSSCDGIFEQL